MQEAATDRATTLRARAADYLLLALELFETPALEKYAYSRYFFLGFVAAQLCVVVFSIIIAHISDIARLFGG